MSEQNVTEVLTAVTATKKPKKKDEAKPRGDKFTPKSEMHVGRNWNDAQWRQAFKAYCAKLDKAAYLSKRTTEVK